MIVVFVTLEIVKVLKNQDLRFVYRRSCISHYANHVQSSAIITSAAFKITNKPHTLTPLTAPLY